MSSTALDLAAPELIARYEPVIGLEVHVQLSTATKIFCGCPTGFGASPNTNVCPVCLGLPGALPVLSRQAVELAIRGALALNCQIRAHSRFARKNYFYPDLPKGYQISQYDEPLAERGYVDIMVEGAAKRIGVTRVHMEDDAGKSVHDGFPDSGRYSYVDLNRSGTPLIEIVSEPDMRNSGEAYAYLSEIKQALQFIEVSTCDMEKGHLRCDANVSVRLKGAEKFGTKAEVKNLNSFRFLKQALDFEIARQVAVLEGGGRVVQETRLYNPDRGETFSMRSKEDAHDYRYFPEPDLPPLLVTAKFLDDAKMKLPELPEARRARMIAEYELSLQDAHALTASREFADRFEAAAKAARNPRRVANLLLNELGGRLKTLGLEQEQSPVSMTGVVLAADLLDEGKISSKQMKQLFDVSFENGEDFPAVYEREKPQQITDASAIEVLIDEVIAANPKQVEQYRSGKKTMVNFFAGQVMKASKGQANPALLNELVTKKLEG